MKHWLFAAAGTLSLAVPITQDALPPAMYSVGGAWDVARHRLVIFGGFGNGGYSGVTWLWDSAWSRLTGEGPGARNGPVLAYDERRDRIVLFGGDTRATGPLGDTWELDGTTWFRITESGPPARVNHAMAYDPVRGRVVLFGGMGAEATTLADTWEWDGVRWARVDSAGGPAPRFLHAMAWDPERRRIILFGGSAAPRPDAEVFGDTWEWDGQTWTRATGAGPGPRDHVAMAYDPGRHGLILEGGRADERAAAWIRRGNQWTRLDFPAPGRSYPVLVTDPRAGVVLLYGGFEAQPSNRLFRLKADRWAPVAP